MKQIIKQLSSVEQDRLVEIDFYMFIQHLIKTYNQSILSMDVLESFAQLFNCNITVIKRLATDIHNNSSVLKPSKTELSVMLYKTNTPLRRIRAITGIHPQTVYRNLSDYIKEGQFEYQYLTDDNTLAIIKSFMSQLNELTGWR